MTTMINSIPKKHFKTLALLGALILVLFAVGFVWLVQGVAGNGRGEDFLAYAPFWIYPYLVVTSVYVGFFAARFAAGRGKPTWFWGITGFALTLLFIFGFPGWLSPIFPYQSPEIFAGPAILAFIAPVISALFMMLLISIRRKATA